MKTLNISKSYIIYYISQQSSPNRVLLSNVPYINQMTLGSIIQGKGSFNFIGNNKNQKKQICLLYHVMSKLRPLLKETYQLGWSIQLQNCFTNLPERAEVSFN